MAAHSGDTHILKRIKGQDTAPPAPWSGRNAGLYSEVNLDLAARPPARVRRTRTRDDASQSEPTT